MLTKLLLLTATLAVTATAAMPSEARPRYHYPHRSHEVVAQTAPPLTIYKRSYLDAGVIVPWGTGQPSYVAESTTLGAPYVTKDIFHSVFESNLPFRFENPGRPQPVFVFETPRDPFGP
jgi:hypothetical protein